MPQIFNNAVMTDNGRALLSKEIAGECMIQITRMSIGSGVYTAAEKDPDTLQKMTALKNEMQSTGLSSLKRQDNTSVIVTGIFTNDNLETAYNINEIGLYAQEKGNRSTEILYSVAVIAEEQGEIMPASEGKNPVRIIQDWVVSVANSANATIEYLPDGAFAMASQVGNVDDLNTKAKENLVDAANELLENTITNNKRIEALENPNFKEPQDDEDPEKAIEQIIPGKPVLELYKNIKSALKGILVVAKKALNIATGKNQARVFATVADLDAWLAVQDNVKKLNVGDNFYIVATDVPDYWWDGTAKQELEVQKIDLTTYDNAITALRSKDEELKQSVAKAISKTAILNTKEQISANTSADNIVGALALKVAMAEYTNQFSQINSNMEHKLSNHGYYNAETSINDMTNPGIYRFYVNPNTDNANYLGWTARTLLICTGDCAGYMYQYFFSDWGHFVYRRNDIQGIITFDYNVLLRRFDAKNEIAELNNRIAALENLIKSNA